MKKFDPDKLKIEYRHGIIPNGPIIPRRYTLIYSDNDHIFLTVALYYAYDVMDDSGDEIKGEWKFENNQYNYKIKVNIDHTYDLLPPIIKKRVFLKRLPLALKAIYHANQRLFKTHPVLRNSSIYVDFESSYPDNNSAEFWGYFVDYA